MCDPVPSVQCPLTARSFQPARRTLWIGIVPRAVEGDPRVAAADDRRSEARLRRNRRSVCGRRWSQVGAPRWVLGTADGRSLHTSHVTRHARVCWPRPVGVRVSHAVVAPDCGSAGGLSCRTNCRRTSGRAAGGRYTRPPVATAVTTPRSALLRSAPLYSALLCFTLLYTQVGQGRTGDGGKGPDRSPVLRAKGGSV